MLPLARHPQLDSQVVVFDLGEDPQALLDLPAEDIAARLYVRQADLPEGQPRVPLKLVHTNKSPALVPWAHLRVADFDRLGIDPDVVEARAARVRAAGPALAEKVRRVYARERPAGDGDVDGALYDGFIGDGDKRLCAQVRATPPHLLAKAQYAFRDGRLPELLFRYRARNWPDSLLPSERERWDEARRRRLGLDGQPGLRGHDFAAFHAGTGTVARGRPLDAASTLAPARRASGLGDGIAADLATGRSA